MGIQIGTAGAKGVYVGSTAAKGVYGRSTQVWPLGPYMWMIETGAYNSANRTYPTTFRAFSAASGARTENADVSVALPVVLGNQRLAVIRHGGTLWLGYAGVTGRNTLYAFNESTLARESSKDITLPSTYGIAGFYSYVVKNGVLYYYSRGANSGSFSRYDLRGVSLTTRSEITAARRTGHGFGSRTQAETYLTDAGASGL